MRTSRQASDNLFEMVRRYHKANPLRPSIQASNAKELKFGAPGSGYRVSTAGTKDTGRGGTFQLAHASEYGFWPNADGHSAGLAQTVADLPGTEIIKESTANGVGNAFHIEWQQAESGEGDYIPISCRGSGRTSTGAACRSTSRSTPTKNES